MLRSYLLISVLLLVVKAVQLRGAGCGQLVGGLAALALALLASRTSTSSAGTYAGQR